MEIVQNNHSKLTFYDKLVSDERNKLLVWDLNVTTIDTILSMSKDGKSKEDIYLKFKTDQLIQIIQTRFFAEHHMFMNNENILNLITKYSNWNIWYNCQPISLLFDNACRAVCEFCGVNSLQDLQQLSLEKNNVGLQFCPCTEIAFTFKKCTNEKCMKLHNLS